MAMINITLEHEGETLDEAINDIGDRYGVTVVVVDESSGDGGWPLVRVNGEDDDALINALRNGFGANDDVLRAHGLID